MRIYEVDITVNGSTTAIDNVKAEAGYTAEQYIADCQENADDDWNEMISHGTITLIDVTEEYEGFPNFAVV